MTRGSLLKAGNLGSTNNSESGVALMNESLGLPGATPFFLVKHIHVWENLHWVYSPKV